MSDEFDAAKTASAEGLYDVEVVEAAAFQLLRRVRCSVMVGG